MRILAVVLLLVAVCAIAEIPKIPAASVTWKSIFGYSATEPQTTFCLMAAGCGDRSAKRNVQPVMDNWLAKHPAAYLARVCSLRDTTRAADSALTYVWIVDGDENLNVELIRQGCFSFFTQLTSPEALQVPKEKYIAFTKKGLSAEIYASEHKLGVFSDRQPAGSDQ